MRRDPAETPQNTDTSAVLPGGVWGGHRWRKFKWPSGERKNTISLIERVAHDKGVSIALGKVEEPREIAGYCVMSTPGVVIDGKVVHAGGVPGRGKVEQWLTTGRSSAAAS